MKQLRKSLVLIGLIYSVNLTSQINEQCKRCNMTIKDQLHKASAIEKRTSIEFDAIECLVNYLKTADVSKLSSLRVVDYNSGDYIPAETAHYLKSKAIPSPMGAYLSAFGSKKEAIKMSEKKGGEIYSWQELRERFKSSDFGVLNHNHYNHYRPDVHSPLGIMGDHLHHKGGFMVSLRYMRMLMDGNLNGTSKVDNEEIYTDYMIAPQEMNMQMYMLGMMYAPSDRLTLMFMQNYLENNMKLSARMNMGGMMMERGFSTHSSGLGDIRVSVLYGLLGNEKRSLHLNSQVNIPVGSIEQRDATPMNDDAKLPYRMQLGSGTFDYSVGVTSKLKFSSVSIGSQIMGTVRTGENREGYRFGNQLSVSVWGAYLLNENISISGRIQATAEGKIEGADSELNPRMVTVANTANYGSKGIRSFLGVNVSFPESAWLHRFRLGAEIGAPIYENYTGIQMNEEISVNAGIKYNIL